MTGQISEAASPLNSTVDSRGGRDGSMQTAMNAVELAALASVLGRKWTPAVLLALQPAPIRHGALTRKLSGIARKVLHESLDGLMADGLVEKVITIDECGRPATTYGLTTLGRSLFPVLRTMQEWCTENLQTMSRERSTGQVTIRLETQTRP